MSKPNDVLVWDPLIRVFHWTLVVTFFTSYLTEGEPEWLHVWSGYLVAVLLLVRILWGLVGTRHARFTDFVTAPSTALRYLKEELVGRARRYLGHNPAGGAMIIALLVCLVLTVTTGLVMYGAEDGAGPLGGWLAGAEELGEGMEEIHELFANLTLFLVGLHVAGVVFSSLRHRENLVAAMWHGYKRAGGDGA